MVEVPIWIMLLGTLVLGAILGIAVLIVLAAANRK